VVVAAVMMVVTAMMMVVAAVMMVVAAVMVVTAMMVVVAAVTMVVVAVVTTMMIVGTVMVAAVVMPAMPAVAATEADADNEFVADDVPAGAVPTIVVPAVNLAIPNVFDIATCRHDLRIDLRQRPAGICRLRIALHDRPEAILDNAVAGPGTAVHKARLHASGLDHSARVGGRRRLRGGRQGKRQAKRHHASESDQARRRMARERHTVF
jgi:signal transduction histidine kinase